MKRVRVLLLLVAFVVLTAGLTAPSLFRIPPGFPDPVYLLNENPLSEAKVLLGRALFYDPLLSRDSTISCESCHSPYTAFAHTDHARSHGIDNRVGIRNAPALFNLAWQPEFMWDGAINHLDVQALAPIAHHDEMDNTLDEVLKRLRRSPLYPELFRAVYGDTVISGQRFLKAISAFMLTLVSADARYDRMKRGELMFTEQEANGYRLFQEHCNACHREPLFTNYAYANNGLLPDTAAPDAGRYRITRVASDSLQFKVPSLRNLEYSYPYMHDGRFKTLSEVIRHYTNGIQIKPTLSPELRKPIVLRPEEKVDLQAFLLTLSDSAFVFDPSHAFPRQLFFGKR